MNREDPKERFAGLPNASLEDVGQVGQGASIIDPSMEDEILRQTEEEIKQDEEQRARLAAVAAGIPEIPAPPANGGAAPDPYTLAILQSLQMTQQALIAFIKGQEANKTVPFHEVKYDTPWNPSGNRNRPKLRRPVMVSGFPVNPMMLSDAEINLLNQVKPGRYVNRTWEVQKLSDGTINIVYPNRTIDQRVNMAVMAPSLTALCEIILKDRLQQEEKRRRGSFEDDEDDEAIA
jgi:hypothetical protein